MISHEEVRKRNRFMIECVQKSDHLLFQALRVSHRINAVRYVECAAKSVDRVWDVFTWAVGAAVNRHEASRYSHRVLARNRGGCLIL